MFINPNQSLNPWLGGGSPGPLSGLEGAALGRLSGMDPLNAGGQLSGGPGSGTAQGIVTLALGLLAALMQGQGASNGGGGALAAPNGGSLNNSGGGSGGALAGPDNGVSSNSSSGGSVSTSVGNLPPGLAPHAKDFEDAGRQYGIDPKFLAAISMVETGDGTSSAFRNKKNAMGISSSSGPTQQNSVRDSIFKMARTLANPNGPYKGKRTIEEIGAVYAPVGASNDPNGTNGGWPALVRKKLAQLGGNPNQIFMGSGQTMYA